MYVLLHREAERRGNYVPAAGIRLSVMELSDCFRMHQHFCPARRLPSQTRLAQHPIALVTSPLQQRPVGRLKSLFKEHGIVKKDQGGGLRRERKDAAVVQARPDSKMHARLYITTVTRRVLACPSVTR